MGVIKVVVSVENLPITPTLMWSASPLFDVGDGVSLIDYCKNNDIAVLGIDGFEIKEGKRIPCMDCIIDFPASLNEMDFAVKSIDVSRKIIKSMIGSDILMEFVLVRF